MTISSDPRAEPLPDSPDASRYSPASAAAMALLAALIGHGVRDLVLCPGSRSQALALAAARLELDGALRLHVRIDERVAGFLALGLAVESGAPVAVVVTSGTAVANLHPAVLEASHAGVPLVLLTADRPAEVLGTGANQTTVQSGIFGGAVRRAVDLPAPEAVDGSVGLAALVAELLPGLDGPLHLNLAYRDPLSGGAPAPAAPVALGPWTRRTTEAAPLVLEPRPHTVVVAGAGAGAEAEQLARDLGAPLLAEVASGARFGPNAVPAYRRLLAEPGFGDAIERVVVVGHPTLSREVPALIQRDGVEAIVLRGPTRDAYDPGHRVAAFAARFAVEGEPDVAWARPWIGRWVHASREVLAVDEPAAVSSDDYRERAGFAREQLGLLRAPVTRRDLVEAVWAATWPHDRLVLGASRLIREADAVVPGKRLTVHANRGLSGIDGTVSTAIGVALAAQAASSGAGSAGDATRGTTRVLLGDLALLHDVGALLFGVGETRPRIQVIVGDDGGGTIFDSLEVAGSADPALFDRVLLTPQRIDLAALAVAYGWDHRLVANRGDLATSLTAVAGPTLVEVPLARA